MAHHAGAALTSTNIRLAKAHCLRCRVGTVAGTARLSSAYNGAMTCRSNFALTCKRQPITYTTARLQGGG